MDNKTHVFEDLDFANLPITGDTLVFANEIMLADNFDPRWTNTTYPGSCSAPTRSN